MKSRSGAKSILPAIDDARVTGAQGAVQDPMLGEILRRTKGLSAESIQRALDYQREQGVRFGEAVVRLRLATSDDVVWALSQQFHYAYAGNASSELNDELVVAHKPFDDSVEIFRDLRTQLLLNGFGSADDRAAMAVVSANRGDGKTFIAANLAVAFGQLPGRTVVVDADLRSPRLHQIFDSSGSTGLTTVLSGRTDASVIRSVKEFPNLFLLPAGPTPPNPSELFLKPAFSLLLNELTNKFDYVIVDTPAAEHGSDARVIASRCGASLAISRKNHSKLPELQKLVTQMSKSQVKISGVVMNEF
ncbi:polysaccharide biosynthesis tyrosine autokinase [Rubrivivax sp. A210]|uniref:polysaccharide biosynthesis tyrosine autokinase n=1 Tax=Rubrivivax sp. A210 TaxID=2772301 RepID=UPI001F203968|nr:polysaccharide biosynthesis tyrosine autokinase [Rubrivivax sp. A210]